MCCTAWVWRPSRHRPAGGRTAGSSPVSWFGHSSRLPGEEGRPVGTGCGFDPASTCPTFDTHWPRDDRSHLQAMMEAPGCDVLRVIDLETTGQGFADGGVVEVGWQDLAREAGGAWALRGGPGARLVRPEHPISPQTSAIHHIVDEDVADALPWQEVAPEVLQASPGAAPLALVAHRASFEQRWCRPQLSGGARWICTYKCALRLWPDSPTHSNQGLRQ